jgi:hypothetical protein
MKKISMLVVFLVLLLALMSAASSQSAFAQGTATPKSVYVNATRTDGNEDGSTASPYTSLEEGVAYAQAQPYGGRLYVLQPDGTWKDFGKYGPVTAGAGGTPIADFMIYVLLAALAIIMILAGRYFQRQSGQLQK